MINKLIRWYLRNYKWKNFYILDLEELFRKLSLYEYFLIKLDTFYTPKEFPKKYPIGKDLDIFSSKKDYEKVNKVLLNFANKYKNKFNIKIIERDEKYSIRLENFGQLYYQLDNNYFLTDTNISSDFIKKTIQNRIFINGYYILPIEYEVIFRLLEIKKNPMKVYHIEYIKNNLNKIDISLIPNEIKDIFFQIKEGKI